jgi:FKBP-type peptidyl-prolyl cis-trans isomerase FklB
MMMTGANRTRLLLVVSFPFVLVGCAQASQEAARTVAGPILSDIQLSFKRDPRVVDPYRGIGLWASGPKFGGATAQDSVEVRAVGVDAAGKPTKISPRWIPSDPKMVTVSPSQGDDVQIKVLRAGESKLKISERGLSKELDVRAKYVNAFMLFEIEEVKAMDRSAPAATQAPPTLKSKSDVSYAAGMNLAKAFEEQAAQLDVDSLMQGVKDKLSGSKTRMTEEQALAALGALQIDQRIVEQTLNRKAVGEKNKREGEAFLAENKKKEGVVTLPSGLQYKIIKAGEGKKPTIADVVNVNYRGTFVDGKEFENTFGRRATTIPVKALFKGWVEALQLMPVGSRWQLFVPSDLAYGEHGAGGSGGGKRAKGPRPQIIGPNATLIYEVELLSAQTLDARPTAFDSRAQKNDLTPEMLKTALRAQPKSAKNQ